VRRSLRSKDGPLSADWAGGTWQYPQTLSGLVAPNSKFTIANRLIIPSATFVFDDETIAMPPRLSTIHLLPPISSDWSEVSVSVSGSDATNTIPAIVYVTRNISATTGAYLSSFTTFTPDESFQLESDALYELPEDVDLQIVEVYPQPKDCSPAEQTPLCSEYVKLYNPSDYAINLGKFRLRSGVAGQSSSPSNTTELPMELLPANTYVSYRLGLIDSGGWVWIEDMYGLERYDSTIVSYPSSSSREGVAWSLNPRAKAWQWTPYPTPYNAENVFSQGGRINNCEGLALSEIAANNTPQFIELINRSDSVLDISGCQLQTNRSQTTSYIFADNTKLAAGGYVTVAIADTELALTKTTNGTVYLLSSDGSV
jgi:hypothetical protein